MNEKSKCCIFGRISLKRYLLFRCSSVGILQAIWDFYRRKSYHRDRAWQVYDLEKKGTRTNLWPNLL